MSTKCFVLDTNVLLHDPNALRSFDDNKIIIPIYVLEEIDNFKKEQSELGRNARQVSRLLDGLRKQGSLLDGVQFEDGIVQVRIAKKKIPDEFVAIDRGADSKILGVALEANEIEDCPVIFVTKDINLRIRAAALNLRTEDYDTEKTPVSDLYTGIKKLTVCPEAIDELFSEKEVPIITKSVQNNSFGILTDGAKKSALVRFDTLEETMSLIRGQRAWGINARNKEQQFALELLMDDNIRLVTLVGQAGTGKTLLALAAGLQKVAEEKEFQRLLISRPVFPLGKDIGFLPGDMEEKLRPWMQPIFDNLDLLMGLSAEDKRNGRTSEELFGMDLIQVEPLTYIRGRSIPNQYIIVDECFPYNQSIVTETGKRKIGSLFCDWVKGKTLPRVLSFNTNTKTFEHKKILAAKHQGEKELVEIVAGNKKIKCTRNHPFLTTQGWVKAQELTTQHDLVLNGFNLQNSRWLNDDQLQLAIGSYLGDGSLSKISEGAYRLSFTHGIKQSRYAEHKAWIFQREVSTIEKNGSAKKPAVRFSTLSIGLPFEAMGASETTCETWAIDRLDTRGLAVWFMDDGSKFTDNNGARFHTESFDEASCSALTQMLNERFFLEASVHSYRNYFYITLTKTGYIKLCKLIAPFVHENLAYKIHDYEKLNGGSYKWDNKYEEFSVTRVTEIKYTEVKQHVFDIEVEDNKNFVAAVGSSTKENSNGFVVHNSQNLTPHEVKTIITRCGEGTKIILTGDPNQIDNPYIDSTNNGLIHVVNRFKGQPMFGHITLCKGERSGLAEVAARLL